MTRKIDLPVSKSYLNRLLILQAQVGGDLEFGALSLCPQDSIDLIKALQAKKSLIWVGEGASTFRFLAALLALSSNKKTLVLGETLRRRSHEELLLYLRHLDVKVHLEENHCSIQGPLRPEKVQGLRFEEIQSSQNYSALQLLKPLWKKLSPYPKSSPSRAYAELSQKLARDAFSQGSVSGLVVEKDWSAASCFIAFQCFQTEELFFPGLSDDTFQADFQLMELISKKYYEFTSAGLRVLPAKGKRFTRDLVEFDLATAPDLFAALIILSLGAERGGILKNVSLLKAKECDRLSYSLKLLKYFGQSVFWDARSDLLKVDPLKPTEPPVLEFFSPQDHRIVMLETFLHQVLGGSINDKNQCVKKSFPQFFEVFRKSYRDDRI